MFRLSDATRRVATAGLFFLLCLVPTVVLLAVGLWRCLPGRIAAEERRLALLLGQPVQLRSVRQLRPGAAVYEGLQLLDPETGKVLLECDRLRVQMETVRPEGQKADVSRLRIAANRATVVSQTLEALRPAADRLLQRRIGGLTPLVLVTARQLVMKDLGYEFPAHADISLQPQQSKVELKFQLKGQARPVYLCVVRNRDCAPPVDGFLLVSGDEASIPASLLSAILPPFPDLGPGCRFQGWINANHVPVGCRRNGQEIAPGWQLDVRGCLLDLELQKLVADHLPHEVSGSGTLQLEQLKILAGRISVMKGSLRAERGRISRDLLASCVQELGLETTFPIRGPTSLLVYDELALGFHLDGSGLRLLGECRSSPEGAMLLGYAYRLDEPSRTAGPIPPTKAIAALTSTPEIQLSTSGHAAAFVRRVPLISPAPAATIAAPRPAPVDTARH
ncbi:MAG: hypothetical protein ACYC6Y_24225 [Thermoguttaceae bacterium]